MGQPRPGMIMIANLRRIVMSMIVAGLAAAPVFAFDQDTISTTHGDLILTFIGHGSLMMRYGGRTIHIDPWSRLADYATLPKADCILLTHEHGDHCDLQALEKIRTDSTVLILTKACAGKVKGGTVMNNGERREVFDFIVETVPAYNLVHIREDGTPFHTKGSGNGYVLTFGRTRVYVAGDTENIPEMKDLADIAIAFLPMNLPYTMIPEMVADAARAFKPKILYPYHYGSTDPQKLVGLLKDVKEIEVRVRKME